MNQSSLTCTLKLQLKSKLSSRCLWLWWAGRWAGNIFLLLTIICANSLNGMEAERIGDLPEELRDEIATAAILSSESPDDAIIMIKKLSVLFSVQYDKLFSNLKDFTRLVHMLGDKFNLPTKEIAERFDTEKKSLDKKLRYALKQSVDITTVAKKYSNLAKELSDALQQPVDISIIAKLIEQGADVNYTFEHFGTIPTPILAQAVSQASPEAVKLLIDGGANPYSVVGGFGTSLDYLHARASSPWYPHDKATAIEELLQKAMQKYHQ